MGRMNVRIGAAVVVLAIVAALAFGRRGNAGDGPYAREVADAVPRLEEATGLKFKTPPKVEERTKEQVRDYLL